MGTESPEAHSTRSEAPRFCPSVNFELTMPYNSSYPYYATSNKILFKGAIIAVKKYGLTAHDCFKAGPPRGGASLSLSAIEHEYITSNVYYAIDI